MNDAPLFGTDGVRGEFGRYPLDEATVRRLGSTLGRHLTTTGSASKIVLGGDTRASTPTLCRWLASELVAHGHDIIYLDTVPTPAVAHAVQRLGAGTGIAVSASHNPFRDNGIKLFDAAGNKWRPRDEAQLESDMRSDLAQDSTAGEVSDIHLVADADAVAAYLGHLARDADRTPLTGDSLGGLALAFDAANGAASALVEPLFTSIGAHPEVFYHQPDGTNINADCGSTHPSVIADLSRKGDYAASFAFDGDADRVIMVDEQGQVRDGDAILFLLALDLKARGQLTHNAIVATSMSNLGLELALREHGIEVVRCGVGDRQVQATMTERGLVLGGEQSGHIIDATCSTTGDGLLTAVQLAVMLNGQDRPVSELLADLQTLPQLLRSLRVRHKPELESLPEVVAAQQQIESELGDEGRLVLRYSGTEPKVRLMIEGLRREHIEALADRLQTVLEQELC